MPESPRWLLLKGRDEDARSVLASLDRVPLDDALIDLKVQEIKDSIADASGVGVMDLFKQGKERNFHRTALGFVIQMFQQISGINLITYYAATIFQNNIGMTPLVSRIVAAANGTEYFLASWIAVYTIEKFGRRKLMIWGAVGMSACMAILAGTTSPAALNPVGGDPTGKAQNQTPAYVATVFLFLFNTCFAIGWLGMTWLYPAEITPLSIRAAANGISTSANWREYMRAFTPIVEGSELTEPLVARSLQLHGRAHHSHCLCHDLQPHVHHLRGHQRGDGECDVRVALVAPTVR